MRIAAIAILTVAYVGMLATGGAGWDWLGIHLRWLPVLFLIAALPFAICHARALPTYPSSLDRWLMMIITVGFAMMFAISWISELTATRFDDEALALEFPLRDGDFYVGQGGTSDQTRPNPIFTFMLSPAA